MSGANRPAQAKSLRPSKAKGPAVCVQHSWPDFFDQTEVFSYPIGARPGGSGGGCPNGAVPGESSGASVAG
jgi:hypothetical protein